MAEQRLGVGELRDLVNEASREAGRLTSRVEQLEADLVTAKQDAERTEQILADATRERKSFRQLVWDAGEKAFDAAVWIPMVLPVLGGLVVVVMCATEEPEPVVRFHFEAMGSVVEAEREAAPLGERCAVTLDGAGGEHCDVVVTCGDAVLLEHRVTCTLEDRDESSGEDTTYWTAVVIDAIGREGPGFSMDSDFASARVVTEERLGVTVALHELGWDGEL